MESEGQKETGDLREAHCKHIWACLPKLIEWTNLTCLTISIFIQREILGSGDIAHLNAFKNEHAKNMEFYTIIQKRLNFFQVLIDAMEATGQTGVVSLLNSFETHGIHGKASSSTSSSPRKYFRVPTALQEFANSANNSTKICIVVTMDTQITLEKIRENLQAACYVHKSLDAFRKHISSSGEPQPDSSNHQVVSVANFGELRNIINDMLKVNHAEKLVLVTPNENEEFLQDFPEKCPNWGGIVQLGHDKMEWDDLSPDYKQHIRVRLREKVKIDNLEEKLDTLLHGAILVQLIHGSELNMLKDTIPKPLDYYVERIILTRNVISDEIFYLKRDDSQPDTFLLTGIERWELSPLVKDESGSSREQVRLDKITATFMVQDKPSHFDWICKTLEKIRNQESGPPESVHLLDRGPDKRLRWKKSAGKIDRMHQFIHIQQDHLTEKEFLQNLSSDSNLPIFISDSPGMGKSVLLGQIARELSAEQPDREIIFLNIVHFIHQVNETGSVVKAAQNLICKNNLASAVLQMKFNCSHTIAVELLLDGFDELETINYNRALDIIREIMSSYKAVRLWVTSRRHFLKELEATLNMIGYMISPFSEEDQIKFLITYWSSNNTEIDLDHERLHKFSRKCLKKIKAGFNSTTKDIAGIPLQCRLIGEVYEKAALQYSQTGTNASLTTETFEVRSIRQLFEKTIENRFKKYEEINKESKLPWNDVMESHARVALEFLFPEYFVKLGSLFKSMPREEILKVGLLETSSNLEEAPQFVHRTYAEYFIAWLLIYKLSGNALCPDPSSSVSEFCDTDLGVREILTEFLFKEVLGLGRVIFTAEIGSILTGSNLRPHDFTHNVITYFLNSLLKDHLQDIKIRFTNNFSRPRLTSKTMKHLTQVCANGNYVEIFKFLLELNLLDKSEDTVYLFDRDFLFLAIEKSGYEFVKLALAKFEEINSFANRELQFEVLRKASRRGDFSILEIFLNGKDLRQLVKDGHVPELIHGCVKLSKNNSERDIQQRKTICRTLVGYDRSSLDHIDESGRTPLLRSDIHVQLLITLIDLGADLLARDDLGDTILHMNYFGGRQFSNQDYETILGKITILHMNYFGGRQFSNQDYETILGKILDGKIPDGKLKRLVNMKGADGDLPLIRMLKHVDPTQQILERFHRVGFNFNGIGRDHYSVLAIAIKSGRGRECLQKLIDFGGSVDWKMCGKTLLHLAVEFGNVDAVEVLLKQKETQINSKDANAKTPLEYAVHRLEFNNRFETGKLLHNFGGKMKDNVSEDGQTWLHFYASKGDYISVKLLCHCGVAVNGMDSSRNTPLHLAVTEREGNQQNYFDMAQLLLNYGAKPHLKNSNGDRPLRLALRNTNLDLETYNLLNSNTDVKWSASIAMLALRFAMRTANWLEEDEFYSLIEECVEHEAPLDSVGDDGNTALHIAVDKKDFEATRLLVQAGANLDLANKLQQTPLHRAALHSLAIAKFLIVNGANVHLKDIRGHTFLHVFASEHNDSSDSQLDQVVRFLVDRKCSELFDPMFMGMVPRESPVLSLIQKIRPDLSNLPHEGGQERGSRARFEKIIIGSGDFTISRIIRELEGSDILPLLRDRWSDFARELETPYHKINELQKDMLLNKLTLLDVIQEIMEEWVARTGSSATLYKLIQVFQSIDLTSLAELLTRMGSERGGGIGN